MSRRIHIALLAVAVLMSCRNEGPSPAPPFSPIDLNAFSANLKGFNLLGKFDVNWSNPGFNEEDFIIMSDLGFNFARLPLDYLTYTKPGDWNFFLEEEIAEIDQAIEWGRTHGVHVCICLHRAPGYSVNTSPVPANQQVSLWDNPSAQDAFVSHWDFFANRYKDIPVTQLSFNLINEPNGSVDEGTYVNLMQRAIQRIHGINPNRVVFIDGMNYGNDIIAALKAKRNVIQSLHAYEPFTLTHYQASWVQGSESWPEPAWPMTDISNYLFGPWKAEYQSPLRLEGSFAKDSEIIINVKQVSVQSALEIRLNDQAVYTKEFICGPDPGEDWTEIINTQWGYQNISNKDYSVVLPAGGSSITISNTAGDWMTINKITIISGTGELTIIPANSDWGSQQETYTIGGDGTITDASGNPVVLRDLRQKLSDAAVQNIPVMVQEFGVHNRTPHPVTLAFLSDLTSVFRTADVGFALWNLSGSFGVIDSERDDCAYESYRGRQLDSQMLEILR